VRYAAFAWAKDTARRVIAALTLHWHWDSYAHRLMNAFNCLNTDIRFWWSWPRNNKSVIRTCNSKWLLVSFSFERLLQTRCI
jgi:hypothetical protein